MARKMHWKANMFARHTMMHAAPRCALQLDECQPSLTCDPVQSNCCSRAAVSYKFGVVDLRCRQRCRKRLRLPRGTGTRRFSFLIFFGDTHVAERHRVCAGAVEPRLLSHSEGVIVDEARAGLPQAVA